MNELCSREETKDGVWLLEQLDINPLKNRAGFIFRLCGSLAENCRTAENESWFLKSEAAGRSNLTSSYRGEMFSVQKVMWGSPET